MALHTQTHGIPGKTRSESELLCLIRAGDRSALSEFLFNNESRFRNRFGRLMGPLVRRLHDSGDLFLSASRRIDQRVQSGKLKPDHPRDLMAYLNVVGQNRLNRMVRDAKREERALIQYPKTVHSPTEPAPSARQQRILFAMSSLASEDRRMLELFIRVGGIKALSEALGISMESTRQRLCRARMRLSKAMENSE